MRVVVTGANGQLGRCLQDVLDRSNHDWTALSRQQLDIGDLDTVRLVLQERKPSVVINAAAYTAVDRAESEASLAFRCNSEGAANLALVCKEMDVPLIHVSTDYVFAGSATAPYRETDSTAPLGVYGASKLAGENAVRDSWNKHVIVRTAWVFSEYGSNFLKTMLRLGQERDELSVVADQKGTPTYAADLARALVTIAENAELVNGWGIYHFSGGLQSTWYDFAKFALSEAGKAGMLAQMPKVKPITTAQFPTPASRPAYSVLSGEKLEKVYGVPPGDWQEGASAVLQRLRS